MFSFSVKDGQRPGSDIDILIELEGPPPISLMGKFQTDSRINYAMVTALEIIGAATKRLPTSLREPYPDLPWRGKEGIHVPNIHDHHAVDLQMVWDVVVRDIQQILADFEEEEQ